MKEPYERLGIMAEDIQGYDVYIKKHSEKYEKYIDKFSKQIEKLEEKLNPLPKKPKYQFFTEKVTAIKLKKMDEFLAHLKNYEEKTRLLIHKNPENAHFYAAHYEAVINLLEKTEKKPLTSLVPNDFVLVVTQTELYKKNRSEEYKDLLKFSISYAEIGAGIMSKIGTIAAGLIGSITFMALAGPFTFLEACFFFPICAGFFAFLGAIAGAILGGILGFIGGAIVGSFNEIPSDNPYLNGKAFDCNLLKAAYIEACQGADSSNEELLMLGQSLLI